MEADPEDLRSREGLRLGRRCTVEMRESAVLLAFDRSDCPDRRTLVSLDPRPSRDLDHLVEECREVLRTGRADGRLRARYFDAIEG